MLVKIPVGLGEVKFMGEVLALVRVPGYRGRGVKGNLEGLWWFWVRELEVLP